MSNIIWMIVHHPRLSWEIFIAHMKYTIQILADVSNAINEVQA